jgi:hypothetical protein
MVDQVHRESRSILEAQFNGPQRTSAGHDGVGTHLNLQPFLELAISRYTKTLQRRTGIDVSLHWFLFEPSHIEFQLVAAVTALEHLVKMYSARRRSTTILKSTSFGAIKREVDRVFAAAERKARRSGGDLSERISRLRNKFTHINEASFRDRLSAMLRAYRVPIEGMEKEIGRAVQARNVAVHTGIYHTGDKFRELYVHVAVLRELLKRIFFELLRYSGQYHSMLNGAQWMNYPPNGPTVVDPT